MEQKTSDALQARITARLEELGYTIESFNADKEYHRSDCTGNPSVYCGTYAKYNNGSLFGQWIDLTTFDSYDEFHNYCCALHADEDDPELMMQDYECFPYCYYDDCMGEDGFDKIKLYWEMCEEHKAEAVDAWLSLTCGDDLDGFEEAYQGEWDSEVEFAEYIFDECYCDVLRSLPRNFTYYIDYKAFARDLFIDDYDYVDGFVFRR